MPLKIRAKQTFCPSWRYYMWQKYILRFVHYTSFTFLILYCLFDSLNMPPNIKLLILYLGVSVNLSVLYFLYSRQSMISGGT